MKQNRLKESVKNQLKSRTCANCSRPHIGSRRFNLVPRGQFCTIMVNQPKLGTCDQWQMTYKMKTAKLTAHKLKVREKRLATKSKEDHKESAQKSIV